MSWFDDQWNKLWDGVREVGKTVIKTVDQIIQHPLPTLITYALTMVGVPPPIASAAVTWANGGNAEDIAKSAAISYAADYASETASNYVGATGPSQGAYIPSVVDSAIIKIGSSAVGASVAGTTVALLQGKSFDEALTAGKNAAVNNLATSAAGKVVDYAIGDVTALQDLKKLPGGDAFARATTNALTSGILGKDASKTFQQTLANSFVKTAGKELIKNVKDYGADLQDALAEANSAKSLVDTSATQQQSYIDDYNAKVAALNKEKEAADKALADFNADKTQAKVDIANSAIKSYNDKYTTTADELAKLEEKINAEKTNYEALVKDYNDKYQPAVTTAVDTFADAETKNAALVAAGLKNYNDAVQEYTDYYGKAPTEEQLSRIALDTTAALKPGEVAASTDTTAPKFTFEKPATKETHPEFDVTKLPKGMELATAADVAAGDAFYDEASNSYYVNPTFASADISDLTGKLVLPTIEVRAQRQILPQEPELDFPLLDLTPATAPPDNTVTPVEATKPTAEPAKAAPLSSQISIPTLNLRPIAPSTPSTPKTIQPAATPATPATPAATPENLLQDTIQPLPTNPTDIQYYLDMEKPDLAVPVARPNTALPTTAPDELESLLDQSAPQSLEELLQHLRS
jgi:hypothetical protein